MNADSANPANTAPPGAGSPLPAHARGRYRRLLMVVIPLLAAGAGVGLYLHGGRYVETENAYLKATKTPLSTEVSGPVREVWVRENDAVVAGQRLLRLDPEPFRMGAERARARRAATAIELTAMQAEYRETRARIALAQADYAFAERERKRQRDLVSKHFVSASKLDEVEHASAVARQQLAALEQQLQRVTATLGGDPARPIEEHPRYRAALAEEQRAELDLEHTVLHAPWAGRVTKVPDPGEYLNAGNIALVLVADRDLWVEANFNEGDLTHVRPGQPALVRVDTFPGVEWQAVVESLSPASGAEFAVLPPQNATGNWVKIVQRVPVRLHLSQRDGELALRAGLSAWVEIDTGHRRALLGLRWPETQQALVRHAAP